MKRVITMSLIAGGLILTSCGDSKKENNEAVSNERQEMNKISTDEQTEKSSPEMTAEFSDEKIEQAFQEYIALKDALVQTNSEATSAAAKKLQNTLQDENSEIAKIAENIVAENDVNIQREMFSELTAAMDPVLKEAISSGTIYKQFCPMAFEGKGDYWYSTSEQIRNPYFGDKMLKCGRVEETIQ